MGVHYISIHPLRYNRTKTNFWKSQQIWRHGIVLDAKDKAELLAVIGDYHKNLVPLVVPLTLLKHHLGRIPVPYIQDQVYLYPHPKELMLRNHV